MEDTFKPNFDKEHKQENPHFRPRRNKEQLKGLFDEAYSKAESLFIDQINIEDFADLYGSETIAQDLKEVDQMERIFKVKAELEEKEQVQKYGKVFEAIFNQQAEINEWLGENVTTIIPSRYDDIKNGVDTIAEFEEETSKSHLALAIDVTLGSNTPEKKLTRIKQEIKDGKLAQIKYFKTEDFRGELINIPKIVIGVDGNTLEEITDLWMQKKNKELAGHRVQIQILLEAQMQLEAFKKFAERQDRRKLISVYEKSLAIITKILDQKDGQDEETMSKIKADSAYQAIESYLNKEFNS